MQLERIDHVHVYVTDRQLAEQWYADVLHLRRLKKFDVWATAEGPLTLSNASGSVHVALFERHPAAGSQAMHGPTSTIAFGVGGEAFLQWKEWLQSQGVAVQVVDHDLMWSMYFLDPFGNRHEITTEEVDCLVNFQVMDA